MNNHRETFSFRGEKLTAQYQESIEVVPGVLCDVYIHPETQKQDLALITIQPGNKTPVQRVLQGEETIEGYLSGKGKLVILHLDGSRSTFEVGPDSEAFSYSVSIGEIMQWHADENQELQVFEICFPPYGEGRYENLPDSEL